jgi:hypothetical protein
VNVSTDKVYVLLFTGVQDNSVRKLSRKQLAIKLRSGSKSA